jgi:30S ribosomal protein S31
MITIITERPRLALWAAADRMDNRPQALRVKEFPMGKGDRKTRRGKTYRGSYGNTRAHSAQPAVAGAKATVTKPAAVKKAAAPKKKSA